jgi:hypothetical protein
MSKNIKIDIGSNIVVLAFLALFALFVWWFFGAIFGMTLGRLLSYVIVGLIGYALGREA